MRMNASLRLGAIVVVLILTGCEESPDIQRVRAASLTVCPNKTVGQMVDAYMKSPSWESGLDDKDVPYVNVSGKVTFKEKEVQATMQFVFNNDKSSFHASSLELNGVPQPNIYVFGLISNMCDAANRES